MNPGPASSNPSHLFVANGVLYFFATEASGTQKFMRLSGSPTVVQTLAALSPPAPPPGFPAQLQPPECYRDIPALLNGAIYFAANDGVNGAQSLENRWNRRWHASSRQYQSRRRLQSLPAHGVGDPAVFLCDRYRRQRALDLGRYERWNLAGHRHRSGRWRLISVRAVGVHGCALFQRGRRNSRRPALAVEQPEASGTTVVGNIVQNSYSFAAPFGVANGKLLISAAITSSPTAGFQDQLWASDGSSAGTSYLGALIVGGAFLSQGTAAYFSSPGTIGPEPWISDGTVAGTRYQEEINPTAQSSVLWFANFNGVTLFAEYDPSSGEKLWRSDGTTAGTTLISAVPQDLPTVSAAASNLHQLAVGQTFFFVGNASGTGAELYGITNMAPVANPDQATSTNDQQVSVNVLSNDSDPDGSLMPSSVHIVKSPTHGTAQAQSNGTVIYTPATGFAGTDTFSYTVNDNQGATSNAATVTVAVTAPPAAIGDGGGGGSLRILDLGALLVLWLIGRIVNTPTATLLWEATRRRHPMLP